MVQNSINQESSGKPYVLQDEEFTKLFETQEGCIKVLEKFSQRSEVFNGIENYRMLILEANPHTFLTPTHWDSDIIFFVGQGRGTITLLFEDRRESYNIEKGHLMMIPASITFYMINRVDNDKLVLSMFVSPIDNAGNFLPFFGAGGQDTESFLYAFSTEVLETAFNTSNEGLHKLFCQQRNGVIKKATKEQIKALTAEEESNGIIHTSKDCGPCQILSYLRESNDSGNLFMVDYNEYQKLQDFNMFISFCNLTKGCMNSPFISTRATKIIMVVNGRGRVEMVAPSTEKGSSSVHFKKITAELKAGVVFVVPPGHPMVLMGSKDENLESICFEVNAIRNQKMAFAGLNNIMKNMQREAKELAFGLSAEEVDKLINSQEQDFFMRGPTQL